MSEVLAPNQFSQEALARIQELAAKDNPKRESLPVLKINYDEESKYEKGIWVVGQKKENNKIVDEGKQVKSIVILHSANRYSLYDDKEPKNNCRSPIYKDYEKTQGHPKCYTCGKTCPSRADDAKPRCAAQKVVFGLAFTGEKTPEGKPEIIEFVSYIKGKSYFPYIEFEKAARNVVIEGKSLQFPIYSFLVDLGSEKQKEGTLIYYVANFTRLSALSPEDIERMAKKADQVKVLIEQMNGSQENFGETEDTPPAYDGVKQTVVDFSQSAETPVQASAAPTVKNLFDD